MDNSQKEHQDAKKEFNPKDTAFVFLSFTLVCSAVIFALVIYDVLSIQDILSFDNPLKMVAMTLISSTGLVLFGIILTRCIPSQYIDDANKSYQNFSVTSISVFMFFAALFEELLFRGIIQNLLHVFMDSQWAAIIITALLFVGIHVQYFKKPIMLLNIAIPSLVFCWIYFETNNILVPFLAHFLLNVITTLLFKYNLIRFKR